MSNIEDIASILEEEPHVKVLYLLPTEDEVTPLPIHSDSLHVTTYYAFAENILRTYGSYLGFTPAFKIIQDEEPILRSIAEKLNLPYTGLYLDEMRNPSMKNPNVKDPFQRLLSAYRGHLKSINSLDKDTAFYYALQALYNRPEAKKRIRRRFKYLYAEEPVGGYSNNQLKLLELLRD